MNTNKELIEDVTKLITEVEHTHRYSMSAIYSLYNRVFEKQEQAQSCASCLIRKVKQLKIWLSEQTMVKSADKKAVSKKRIRKENK